MGVAGRRQMAGVGLDGLGGLDQAAVGVLPAADEDEPMLDERRQEFGVDLGEDAPGGGRAPLIDALVALPQLEQQLDLPAGAGGPLHPPLRWGT